MYKFARFLAHFGPNSAQFDDAARISDQILYHNVHPHPPPQPIIAPPTHLITTKYLDENMVFHTFYQHIHQHIHVLRWFLQHLHWF